MRTVVLLGVLIWCTNVLHANNRFDFDFDSDKARLYIEKYKHIAVAEMDRMGIPASIKMAQALLESGIGESKLAINANNHFGIKCGGEVWTGETYYMWDDEPVKSCFRVYETAEESFIAHSEFLRNPKKDFRYGVLFDLDKKDYEGWAKGLQKSGYATSKTYSKKLISLIERLELYKLDHLTSQTLALEEGELANIFPSLGPHPDIKDLDAVYVQPNDVIGSIAKRYKIAEKRLIDYNEIYNKKDKKLKTGQYIYLQRKKNFYHHRNAKKDVETHIVRQGQSMYDIAQQYGIKICKLYRLNPAYHCSNPPSGVLIFLRKSKRKNK
jgi:LysM repeat protein